MLAFTASTARYNNKQSVQIKSVMALSIFQAGHAFLLFKEWRQVSSSHNYLYLFREWMCMSGLLWVFLSILAPPFSPLPPCSHHHWTTVEVVSGRGMMPNLTGVNPYLYSLHSRFCFKGFVYTRPINHLLPSHNPIAFKVGARLLDNVQCRCQCKSPSSPLKEKNWRLPELQTDHSPRSDRRFFLFLCLFSWFQKRNNNHLKLLPKSWLTLPSWPDI